jgi:hypothetical protein
MIAIHGMDDGTDPYWGGGHSYWGAESVPQAVEEWSQHNGCKRTSASENTNGVVVHRHTQCTDGAEIVLVSIEGGGHAQAVLSPSKSRWTIQHGPHKLPVTYVNITEVVWQFFLEHGAVAASGHKAARPLWNANTLPLNNYAFQGDLSSAMSKSEVHRSVNTGYMRQPVSVSAGHARTSNSRAKVVCTVTLVASLIMVVVSGTLFIYFQSRMCVSGNHDCCFISGDHCCSLTNLGKVVSARVTNVETIQESETQLQGIVSMEVET